MLNHEKVVPALKRIGEYQAADLVSHCGDFINVIKCNECGTLHYGGFESCRGRWCLNCMHKRLICWLAKLIPVFERWYEDGNYVSMLNFTVRDGPVLRDTLSFLEDSYRKLYNSNKKRREHWNERFPGGIRSLEVKEGENSKLWHPHYHCLVMQKAGKFEKDYDWLSVEWHNIVGFKTFQQKLPDGSVIEIEESAIRKDGALDLNWNGNLFIKKVSQYVKGLKGGRGGILSAVCETLKYIVKVGNLEGEKGFFDDDDKFKEAYYTLKGKRQVSTWGLLYNIESEVDEAFEKESYQQLKDFVCQSCGCTEGELMETLYFSLNDTILFDIHKNFNNRKNIKKRLSVRAESPAE